MSVEGRAFLKLFREQVATALPSVANLRQTWDASAKWTEFMLGSSERRATDDHGVLGSVGKTLGYHIQSEYFRVDQIWYSTLPTDKKNWIIEAFIEHENNVTRLPEMVRKVLQLGSGLKVLVTYPEGALVDKLVERTSQQVTQRYGTAPDARILLVLGELAATKPVWFGYEFDGLGRHTPLQ